MRRTIIHRFKMKIFLWRIKKIISRRFKEGDKKVTFACIKNVYWIYVSLKILKKRGVFNIQFKQDNETIFEPDCIVTKNK